MTDVSRKMLSAWWLLNYGFSLLLSFSFLENGLPGDWRAWLYGVAVWLTYALVYILPAIALSYLAWRLFYRRWPRLFWMLAVLLFGVSYLLIFADGRLYGLFGFHINSFVINLVTTPGGIDSLGSSGEAELVFAAIAVVLLLAPALLLLPAHWLVRHHPRSRIGFSRKLILLLVLLAVGERLAYGISRLEYYQPVLKVADAFPLYNRVRFKSLAMKLGYENKRPRSVSAGMAKGDLNYPLKPLEVVPPQKPMNMVWLVAESLRWDMLTPQIMPNTWKFAGRSLKLDQHMSGGNGTRQGLFSLMYGLYGAYWNAFLGANRGPVLLDVLKDQGYQFYMTTSASFTYLEFDRPLFAAIDAKDLHHADMSLKPWQRDIDNAGAVNRFITERDKSKPFMSFFFFESTHARYDFPDSSAIASPYLKDVNYALMSRESLKKDVGEFKNRYINASHHVDLQIGRILDTLEEQGLLENTIVVITGDHGEEFMEKGHWGHNAGFHEEQIHVPMVLHIPGRAPQACLRPRDRFWDIPVPKIDSAFDNLFVPQPSWSPSTTQQLRKLVAAPYLAPNDWTPRSEAYFVFPLAQGTPGKQCGLAATGVYQPSLRSPWLAAEEIPWLTSHMDIIPTLMPLLGVKNPVADYAVSAQESTPVFPT